jgi:hypothetical protein
MAIRDKIRQRVGPMLPGQNVRYTIWAQSGVPPFLNGAIFFFLMRFKIIAVTDQSITVFKSSRWSASPKEMLGTFPRATRLGPTNGVLWSKTYFDGEKTYVHRRFWKDIEAADAEIGGVPLGQPLIPAAAPSGGSSQPANWYPDPQGQARLRWWDGNQWTDQTSA